MTVVRLTVMYALRLSLKLSVVLTVRLTARLRPSARSRLCLCLLVLMMLCPTLMPCVTMEVSLFTLQLGLPTGSLLSDVNSLGLVRMLRPTILL